MTYEVTVTADPRGRIVGGGVGSGVCVRPFSLNSYDFSGHSVFAGLDSPGVVVGAVVGGSGDRVSLVAVPPVFLLLLCRFVVVLYYCRSC